MHVFWLHFLKGKLKFFDLEAVIVDSGFAPKKSLKSGPRNLDVFATLHGRRCSARI